MKATNNRNSLWSREQSQYLRQIYNEHLVHNGKVKASKPQLWEEITAEFNKTFNCARSKEECIEHCNALQEKQFEDKNRQHKTRKRVLEKIAKLQNDDDSEEEVANIVNILEYEHVPDNLQGLQLLANTIRNTLLEMTEIKERNRERQHRETMQMLEKYLTSEKKDCEKSESACTEQKKQEKFGNVKMEAYDYIDSMIEQDENTLTESKDNEVHNIGDGFDEIDTDDVAEEFTNTEVSTISADEESLNVLNGTTQAADAIKTSCSQRAEYKLLREQMLEMQRKKMEDRERKKISSMIMQ